MPKPSKYRNHDLKINKVAEQTVQTAASAKEYDIVPNLYTEHNLNDDDIDLARRLLSLESLLHDVVHENTKLHSRIQELELVKEIFIMFHLLVL